MVTLKKLALACAAAAAVAASTPAMADVQTKEVGYDDLDLSSEKGQARFQKRINAAVKAVCDNPRAFTLAEKADWAQCKANAKASAMSKAERTIARYKDAKRLAANESAVVGN